MPLGLDAVAAGVTGATIPSDTVTIFILTFVAVFTISLIAIIGMLTWWRAKDAPRERELFDDK